MSDLDPLITALREARAALLNAEIHESDKAHVVRVIEGALEYARICGPDAEILRPVSDEELKSM